MTQSFRDRFVGIIPPVITPFDDDGRFDSESAERLYAFPLDFDVHGLFLFGSSGEGPLLGEDDRLAALKTAVHVVGGRVPILAGVLTPGTEQAIRQARMFAELGADAVVVAPPFYFSSSQDEILEHFRAVHRAVSLPLVAYDIPVTVKTKISLETMLQLARENTIVGMKDSSGDVSGFRRLLLQRPDGFRMHTGSELILDNVLSQGADGSVPGLANVDPRVFVELYEHWQAGRYDEARDAQERIIRLFDIFLDFDGQLRIGVAIGAMKTAMKLRGVISSNRLCPPFAAVDDDYEHRIANILAESNLLEASRVEG